MRNLRAERARAGLTIEELSKRAGVAISTISLAESGQQRPRAITLQKLANALGVPVETFLEEEPARPLAGSTPGRR